MPTSNIQNQDQDQNKDFDPTRLNELLEKIHTPPDRIGLSYAITELLESARAILNLVPSSQELIDLVSVLEDSQNLKLPNHRAVRGLNPMYGRYPDFPLYSLLTQGKRMDEPIEFTANFHLVTGFLVASVWLSSTPWHPIPYGFEVLVYELRRIRNEKKWKKLLEIDFKAESLQALVHSLSEQSRKQPLQTTICNLAIKLNEELTTDAQQPASIRKKPSLPPQPKPELPSPPKPTEPNQHQPKDTQPRQQEPDLGDHDEWKTKQGHRFRPVVTGRPPPLVTKQIVLRKPAPHQPGIDNAETGVVASIAEAPATPGTDEPQNLQIQKLQVLDARFATEFDNQFLPFSWEALNETEVAAIISAIKTILSNKHETRNNKIGALVAGLSIMTSRSPAELAAFRILHSKTNFKMAGAAVLIGNACWYSPFPTLERFEPDNEQALWLRPVGDGCYLPLPTELLSALSELSTDGITIGEALGCSVEELEELAQTFCKTIRKDARSRANVSWMRSIMFYKLLALSGDDVGIVATLGNTEHAPSTGLYYATFEQYKWRGIYGRASTGLRFTASVVDAADSLPYGSRQYPDETKLRQWIATFSESTSSQCKKAKSIAELIEAHNQFAGYSFLMLLACTGHRPADPYSFGILSVDLENGWIILSDKITSPSTRVRLIPLPPLVVKQLQNYQVHLRNLSNRIQGENPELADKISMLFEAPVHALIPLFFWLDEKWSASAIDMSSFIKRYNWPFERNVFRHCLATGLRNKEALSEYIAILLGHVGIGQFGFGKFSALSPSSWKDKLSPAIKDLLESQGWINIAGLTHTRASLPFRKSQRPQLEKIEALDCFTRARAHVEESKSDRQIVRAAFMAAKQNTPPESPKDEFLAAFKNEIINRSIDSPDRLAKRLNFHVRFIRLHRHALNPSSIPGWATDMHGEDTPFDPDSLALAKIATHYRDSIPDIAKDFLTLSYQERVALILISSVVSGGLLRKTLVELLPARLNGGVRWFEGYLWIDFDDPASGGIQRWFPDPATALLIVRFIKSEPVHQYDKYIHFKPSVVKLLSKMQGQLQGDSKVSALDDLIRIGKAFFALKLPGLLRAYAGGDVRSASLTEACWLRLLSGHPLAVEQVESATERGSMRSIRHTSEDVKSALKNLKDILEAIRDAFPPSASGATDRRAVRRNSLTKLLKNVEPIAESGQVMPSIVHAIIAWTNHLAVEGSVVVRKPAVGTIYSYVTDIGRPLIQFCSEVDFVELSDAELVDIYQRVIDCGSKDSRSSRAKSLRWFHEFCEEEFDISEVDWDEVAPGLTYDRSKVSANLVTFSEYCIAKTLISNHPRLNIRERQMYLVALILIYRCGLRLGELLRLTVSDLILETNCVMLVRNGIYGKTKTRAGVRQIPWLKNSDGEEKKVIQDWIEHRTDAANGDPWAAIFGTIEEVRTLEVRLQLSRVLMEVLRTVTGDPTTKIHHLRHGAGTNAIAITLSTAHAGKVAENIAGWFGNNDLENVAADFRQLHLGQPDKTRRIVYAIAQSLGHTSPRTSCWHYGHLLDFGLYEHVSSLASLKNIEVANLSGMTQSAIGVAVFKSSGKTAADVALHWLLKDIDGLKPTTKLADQPLTITTLPLEAPIHPFTSPKLAHIILTDLSSGFAIEKIAARYARETSEIQSIDAAANIIERRTGYREFRIFRAANDVGDNNQIAEQKMKLKKLLTGHAIDLLGAFQKLIENPKYEKILADAVGVWLEQYRPSHSGLQLTFSDDVSKMINLFDALGIKKGQIALASNSSEILFENSNATSIGIWPENILRRSNSYRSVKRTPLGVTQSPTLLVTQRPAGITNSARKSSGGASLQMHKLHHLLFLASVLQGCKK
ncbi:MAG: tyrosine-type recombinase/integrase [Gallionella sp.]|nr:tyrosine-type recombinase/integrase [Gallionella sp.]